MKGEGHASRGEPRPILVEGGGEQRPQSSKSKEVHGMTPINIIEGKTNASFLLSLAASWLPYAPRFSRVTDYLVHVHRATTSVLIHQ